jgi:negative regulator of sigma E activity
MNVSSQNHDKLDLHLNQQLSALMDGDLPADEARFLLRRLQHDETLKAQWERWQWLGDALRGQAAAPAPAGFALRVSDAIASEKAAAVSAPVVLAPRRSRRVMLRWGGAAVAASVALVALFITRPHEPVATQAAPLAATPVVVPTKPVEQKPVEQPAPVQVAVAPSVDSATRHDAVRTTQTTHSIAATHDAVPMLAADAHQSRDPFSVAGIEAQGHARPWPHSVLGYSSDGAFSASYDAGSSVQGFNPFEPHPADKPKAEPQPQTQPQN